MSKKVESYESNNIIDNEGSITIDKEYTTALTSPNNIEVIEINMPSSQALKSFGLKLMKFKTLLEGGCNNER